MVDEMSNNMPIKNVISDVVDLTVESFDTKKELFKCIHCNNCKQVCSTYSLEKTNSSSYSSKLFLFENLFDSYYDNFKLNFIESIYKIASPGAVKYVCPAKIKHKDLIVNLRYELFNDAVDLEQFSSIKLALNNLYDDLYSNIYGVKKENKFVGFSKSDLIKSDTLLYFGSHELIKNKNRVKRIIEIMNKLKLDYSVSNSEPDSGYFAYIVGDLKLAKHFENLVLDFVSKNAYKKIIVVCPHEYDRLKQVFNGTSIEIVHVLELIDDAIKKINSKTIKRVKVKTSILDSFELANHTSFELTKRILKNIGCDYVEKLYTNDEYFSTGAGTGFDLIYPNVSLNLARKHIVDTKLSQVKMLVSIDSHEFKLYKPLCQVSMIDFVDIYDLIFDSIKWS